MKYASGNRVIEWSYASGKTYCDPFNDVELDVTFEGPDGRELRVPAFWSGEQTWRVRFASPVAGTYQYRSVCSDESNEDLHGQAGVLEVEPYDGSNPLLSHGPLRVAAGGRQLEHLDGTPFFWLGDTWWMGLCRRLQWPGGFQALSADRVTKGFTIIQVVAGLYPDMPPFEQRGANEAGFPWTQGYGQINPAYFDMADLRIDWLSRSGLVPCIVGCWGYYLCWMGIAKMKQHWRNLVARYGAYPVVWCLAGEATMPYYLSDQKEQDAVVQREGWTEVARYVREIDPYHHPITIHPTRYGRDQVGDPSVLDFEMLQTGHSGYRSLSNTANMLTESLAREPRMPVLVSEVNYEGTMETNREEMQRFLFWSCLLSGASGHTYGANGVWQMNTREEPLGPSPHGTSWDDIPWEEAYQLPGSAQLGLGKGLLERYPWWQFRAHPEWIEPHHSEHDRHLPYAAGIPGKVRVVFVPGEAVSTAWRGEMAIRGIDAHEEYRGFYFSPKTGKQYDLGRVTPNADGDWLLPGPPVFQDWVIVLEVVGT